MADYYAILTELGTALMANAALTGEKINVTQFAVGDGNGAFYSPEPSQTELRREVWRTSISRGEIPEDSPNQIDFYAIIPPNVGGFTIREMGVFDDQDRLIGIANTPDIQKVEFDDGVSYDSELSISLAVVSTDAVEFVVDPYTVIATKADVEEAVDEHNTDAQAHPSILQKITEILASIAAHVGNFLNPHKVTAAQVGAPTTSALNSHTSNRSNPHGVTAAQVGLGNVNNTPDSQKTVANSVKFNGYSYVHQYNAWSNVVVQAGDHDSRFALRKIDDFARMENFQIVLQDPPVTNNIQKPGFQYSSVTKNLMIKAQDYCDIVWFTNVNAYTTARASAFTPASSLRYKYAPEDITDEDAIELLSLRPRMYMLKNSDRIACGFIAEEVAEVAPVFVYYDKGEPNTLDYMGMIPAVVKNLQRHENKLADLENRISTLEKEREVSHE